MLISSVFSSDFLSTEKVFIEDPERDLTEIAETLDEVLRTDSNGVSRVRRAAQSPTNQALYHTASLTDGEAAWLAALRAAGYSVSDIANNLGKSPIATWRKIRSVPTQSALEDINRGDTEQILSARRRLVEAAEDAAKLMHDLVLDDNVPPSVRLSASKTVLDRVGLPESKVTIHGGEDTVTADMIQRAKAKAAQARLMISQAMIGDKPTDAVIITETENNV